MGLRKRAKSRLQRLWRPEQHGASLSEGLAVVFGDGDSNRVGTIPIDDAVGHLYFGYGEQGWNPFSDAVRMYFATGQWSLLRRYFEYFRPASLAEAYFCRGAAKFELLNEMSPYLRFKPWRETEVLISGHSGEGNQNFGPVTDAKFRSETSRYESVLESIAKHGYRPDRYGHIKGYFLVDSESRWVFRVTQGFHRAAILDALSWHSIPVQLDAALPSVVHIDTLPYWPKVLDGRVTPSLARYMFQRHFWDRGQVKRIALRELLENPGVRQGSE